MSVFESPLTYGLFAKRIEGDDALLALAQLRFRQIGMGVEMSAGTLEQLEWLMQFRPSNELPVAVHLPRELNLIDAGARQRIFDFAAQFEGRVQGMIVHDHLDLVDRPQDYLRAAADMNTRLGGIQRAPVLFVEYAAGVEPEAFARFFSTIRDLDRLSACIDIGHVGIRQARKEYAVLHPGEDIRALKSQPPELASRMSEVERAVKSALPVVLSLAETVAALGKPLHLHLHDGHPMARFSPFGISDHLSFLTEVPLEFKFRGRSSVPLMFGRAGLTQIVACVLRAAGGAPVSFTLEIHPVDGRLALGEAGALFSHWQDKTNAEKMNHWLRTLGDNHALLRQAIDSAGTSRE
jgi:hypothetical protein